jgi:hypothetical protein
MGLYVQRSTLSVHPERATLSVTLGEGTIAHRFGSCFFDRMGVPSCSFKPGYGVSEKEPCPLSSTRPSGVRWPAAAYGNSETSHRFSA